MNTGHTVLKFIKAQFIGNWHRLYDADKAIYTPNNPIEKGGVLLVVCKGPAGLITYEFFVNFANANEERYFLQVWVNWAENLIHIPALCKKSFDNDTTNCEGKLP